jgi:HAMP domain-containing protein
VHEGGQAAREDLARAGGQPGRPGTEHGRHAGRTPFVLLLLGLLSGGLVCLLVVNTTLAANSIEISRLQQANSARTERIQQLRQQVAAGTTAAVIEQKARKLGMRPVQAPVFIDLRTASIRAAKATAP